MTESEGVREGYGVGRRRFDLMKKKKNRIYKMYVCTVPYLPRPRLYPCTHLPLLFQGVSASDLPTKSISLLPTKDPEEQISSTAE